MYLKEFLTATADYHSPSHERIFGGYAASIIGLLLLGERVDYTIRELTHRLNEAGFAVADSTVSPRLQELKRLGLVTDDVPKRPCRIRGTRKKAWRLTPDARDLVTVTPVDGYLGGAR